MEVAITGIGLLSCLGSLQSTWSNILQRKSGIKVRQPFLELPSYPLGAIGDTPSKIDDITERLLVDTIADAQLLVPLHDCGVVIGSSRGCQANWEALASHRNKPISNWWQTLPDRPALTVARYLQTEAPVLAPMAACATGIWALARGCELIETGRCDRVIAGALETPITPLTLAAFERMGALAKTGCYPFADNREGLVLGEGGAMFVLEAEHLAQERQAQIYGKIKGFGLTCDAHHVSAPQTTNGSAAIAIKQALQRSRLQPSAIDYIHAHGTSTLLNDRHEAALIQHIFPHQVAVSSTKGATGHTLGASGAIGSAFCLMALQQGYLPPNIGARNSEFSLNIVGETVKTPVANTMCFSFGFGGQNAVLVLSKA